MAWLEMDRGGLRRLAERYGRARTVLELVANAFDAGATSVDVKIGPVENETWRLVEVTDNGHGVADLSRLYTLFNEAEGSRRRGRFGLGAKLFLAICGEAHVSSGRDYVVFRWAGDRYAGKLPDSAGTTRIGGYIDLTAEEIAQVETLVGSVIPPAGVELSFNGVAMERPKKQGEFYCAIPTDAGHCMTRVDLYPGPGAVYEYGIPVEAMDSIGLPHRLDVQSPLQLSVDRLTVHHSTRAVLLSSYATRAWQLVPLAAWNGVWASLVWWDDKSIDAARAFFHGRWGASAILEDPQALEANRRAFAAGRNLVPLASLPLSMRRGLSQALPKSSDFYTNGGASMTAVTVAPFASLSPAEQRVVNVSELLADCVLQKPTAVFVVDGSMDFQGAFCPEARGVPEIVAQVGPKVEFPIIVLSRSYLGAQWFADVEHDPVPFLDLLIHELAHGLTTESHLSEDYNDALSLAGARVADYLRRHPEVLRVA